MFNKSNLDYFKVAGRQPEDWLQLSRPWLFLGRRRGWDHLGGTCGPRGAGDPEPCSASPASASRFALGPGRADPGGEPAAGLGFPFTMLCVYRCAACPCSGSAPGGKGRWDCLDHGHTGAWVTYPCVGMHAYTMRKI